MSKETGKNTGEITEKERNSLIKKLKEKNSGKEVKK